MIYTKLKKYLANCFLLLIPVILWNIFFRSLTPEFFHPEIYWEGVNPTIKWAEIILLIFIFIIPAFMPLKIKKKTQKNGLKIYIVGLAGYLISWRPLVLYPEGDWSNNPAGFFAPAVSFLLILIGIGLMGDRLFFKIPYKRGFYLIISFLYILIHLSHYFLFHPPK